MEQRDFLKDQIEQMGRVLSRVLANFMGFKSNAQVSIGIHTSHESLKSELDIDILRIKSFTKDELKEYLEERKLKEKHLEILSELLMEIGESKLESDKNDAKLNLEKALEILQIVDETSDTMSMSRRNKEKEIKNLIHKSV